MKAWCLICRAIDPKDGEIKKWSLPFNIMADTQEQVQEILDTQGLGFCEIDGYLAESEEEEEKPNIAD